MSPQQLPKLKCRQDNFPTPFYTIASTWNCLGVMHSIFLLIAAKSSGLWLPFLPSYAHVMAWSLHWEPFCTQRQLTVGSPSIMKCHLHWWDFSVMYRHQPANKKEALIYTAIALSKVWKHHHIRHLQNHNLAFSGKAFRRCIVMQLQTGFLCTSTDHLDRKGEKQLIGVFRQLCLTCPLLPSAPNLHLLSQHPEVHKYFKMPLSLGWKNTACVLGNR